MVKIMLANTIVREIIRHAQNDHSDDRLLATFHTGRGKKLRRGNLWSEKNICFLDFGNGMSADP
jgi:hypothetical protein